MSFDVLLTLPLWGLCGAAAYYDIRFAIIPNIVVLGVALLAVWQGLNLGPGAIAQRAIDAAIVLSFLLLLRNGYWRLRNRKGLGLGDVKFMTAATLLLGLSGAHIMLLVACVSALADIAVLRLRTGSVSGTTAIRFGPHLALGLVIAQATAFSDVPAFPF